MRTTLLAVCLLALPLHAGDASERCINARDQATQVRNQLVSDVADERRDEMIRTAEKNAHAACTSPGVPLSMRNEAIVRWAGMLNDPSAELNLVKKTLRETEAKEGPDSKAILPLTDHLASYYGVRPPTRQQALGLLERGLRIRRKAFGDISAEAVMGLLYLGAFWQIEDFPDYNPGLAEAYYREALSVAEKACGPDCEPVRNALSMLQPLIEKQPGREAEAAELWQRSARLELESLRRHPRN